MAWVGSGRLTNIIRNKIHDQDSKKIQYKCNINAIAPKYSEETKQQLPLWHIQQMNEANYQWNQKASKCLREHHKIISIGDLIDQESDDDCNKACFNMKKRLVKMVPNIINPEQQTPQKIRNKNLDLTPNRLRRNDKSRV